MHFLVLFFVLLTIFGWLTSDGLLHMLFVHKQNLKAENTRNCLLYILIYHHQWQEIFLLNIKIMNNRYFSDLRSESIAALGFKPLSSSPNKLDILRKANKLHNGHCNNVMKESFIKLMTIGHLAPEKLVQLSSSEHLSPGIKMFLPKLLQYLHTTQGEVGQLSNSHASPKLKELLSNVHVIPGEVGQLSNSHASPKLKEL